MFCTLICNCESKNAKGLDHLESYMYGIDTGPLIMLMLMLHDQEDCDIGCLQKLSFSFILQRIVHVRIMLRDAHNPSQSPSISVSIKSYTFLESRVFCVLG